MALGRTYYTEIDKTEGNTTSTALLAKAMMWMWMSFLTGSISGTAGRTGAIPSGARWTVVGSSDGVTAGLDGSARGLVGASFDPTKWVRASPGTAHSWIVLSKVINGSTFYMVLEWASSVDYQWSWAMTKTAPTGGSVTNAPTLTNHTIFTNLTMLPSAAGGATGGLRGSITVDADGHFWFLCKNAGEDLGKIATSVCGFWDCEDTVGADQNPWFVFMNHDDTQAMLDTDGNITSNATSTSTRAARGRSKTGSIEVFGSLAVLGGSSSVFSKLSGGQDFIRTNDPAQPSVDLWIDTAGQAGRRGVIPDIRVGAAKGDGYADPSAAAIERCLVGSFYLPMMAIPSTS